MWSQFKAGGQEENFPAEASYLYNHNPSRAFFFFFNRVDSYLQGFDPLVPRGGSVGLVTSKALGRAGDQWILLGWRVRDAGRGWGGGSARTHQLRGHPVQRAERVVQEVEAGGRVEVGIAHHMAGEERLAEAAAEQAAHHAVPLVQLLGDSLAEIPSPPTPPPPPPLQPTTGKGPPCCPASRGLWEVGRLAALPWTPLPASQLVSCLALESDHPALNSQHHLPSDASSEGFAGGPHAQSPLRPPPTGPPDHRPFF